MELEEQLEILRRVGHSLDELENSDSLDSYEDSEVKRINYSVLMLKDIIENKLEATL